MDNELLHSIYSRTFCGKAVDIALPDEHPLKTQVICPRCHQIIVGLQGHA